MVIRTLMLCIMTSSIALSACSRKVETTHVVTTNESSHGILMLHASNDTKAEITSSGGLVVSGVKIGVTASERTWLQQYYLLRDFMSKPNIMPSGDGDIHSDYVVLPLAQAFIFCKMLDGMVDDYEQRISVNLSVLRPYLDDGADRVKQCVSAWNNKRI